jgi:ATP-binding cassette subfamily F protein 3
LLEALNDYEGAVVLISHDRRLIDACADRLVLVAEGRAQPFDGDMEDYKRLVLAAASGPAASDTRESKSQSRAELRREAAGQREKLRPLKSAMDRAEREVAALHDRITEIDAALAEPGLFAKDPRKGEALSRQRAEAARTLEAAEHRWIAAAEAYEAATNLNGASDRAS